MIAVQLVARILSGLARVCSSVGGFIRTYVDVKWYLLCSWLEGSQCMDVVSKLRSFDEDTGQTEDVKVCTPVL